MESRLTISLVHLAGDDNMAQCKVFRTCRRESMTGYGKHEGKIYLHPCSRRQR